MSPIINQPGSKTGEPVMKSFVEENPEYLKSAGELFVGYLEHVLEALKDESLGGKDAGLLFNKLNGRLLFTPALGKVTLKEPRELIRILCDEKVLESFGLFFAKWKPRVNEENLTETKQLFYNFFFEPIEQSEVWVTFWERQVQLITERMKFENKETTDKDVDIEVRKIHDEIASAVIYRIQQSWLGKENSKLETAYKVATTESERDEILKRVDLLNSRVAVFTTIINNAWDTLDHFLGTEVSPEKGTIYYDFNDEMHTLKSSLHTQCKEIILLKGTTEVHTAISKLAAQIQNARKGKGFRNLGEDVNEGKMQNTLRHFVTTLMDDNSKNGKKLLEVAAQVILTDIENSLKIQSDSISSSEYFKTIELLATIENKTLKKKCTALYRRSTPAHDKSEFNFIGSDFNVRGRADTISTSDYHQISPGRSPLLTVSHNQLLASSKPKEPGFLDRFFKRSSFNLSATKSYENLKLDQKKGGLKKNNSFMIPEAPKEAIKKSASFFKSPPDTKENQKTAKTTILLPGLE